MNHFESGYNGQPWTKRSSPEDFFYFDMKSCDSSSTFKDEIDFAINEMRARYSNLKFFNDNSFIAKVILPRLKPDEIVTPSSTDYFDFDFWTFLSSEYKIIYKKDLALLTLAKKLECSLVWPMSSGRIINSNFSRHFKKSLGSPYWVYLESERFHKIRLCSQELKLNAFPDLLKLTPRLSRSYFLHPLHLSLFSQKEHFEPHNDLIERQIWNSLSSAPQDNLYPEEWTPKEEFMVTASAEKVAQFPIHSFLLKYFQHSNDFHSKEQAWYGSVD